MALMEWTPSLSVNVKVFDEHHQHLFDLLNTLHDSMRVGKGREVIDEILSSLADYTQRHFSAEEAVLKKTNYAGLSSHLVEHKKFIATVARLQKQSRDGVGSQTHEVVTFLQDWLKNHIMKSDRAYGPHMTANRIM
jgi:hemerythrin